MKRFRILNNGIISDVYTNEAVDYKSCIYFGGLPTTIGNNSLTDELVKRGILVVQPHYPGTYDSAGQFTPRNAVGMVDVIRASVNNGQSLNTKSNEKVVLRDFDYAVGNSFGAFVALKALRYLPNVERLFLFAPALTYGAAAIRSGFKDEGVRFLEYLKRSRPYTYRLGDMSEWERFFNGELNAAPIDFHESKLKEVIGVVGSNDSSFDLDLLRTNFFEIIRRHSNKEVSVRLIVVEGGGHGIGTLMSSDVIDELNKLRSSS